MIDISIIIPIYNVEKYLSECLDSVYKLDLSNKEIILVNDGSTDNSLEIATEYKNKYLKHTILISEQNKGLSEARNTGIKNSRGKYIFFLDSDDFIDSNEIEDFFKEGIEKNQDILIGNYYEYYNKINKTIIKYPDFFLNKINKSGEYFLENAIKRKCFTVVVWRNLYKKKFLIKNNLFFEKELLHEDSLFSLKVFLIAKKIAYSKKKFYYYRQNNLQSITKNKTQKNYIHMLFIIQELILFQKKIKKENPYYNRVIIGIYWDIIKNGHLKNKKLFQKIKKLNFNFKEKLKILIILLFSIKCKEIKKIEKIK